MTLIRIGLMIAIGSLLLTSFASASDSSLTITDVSTRTFLLLGVDTTGTDILDTAIVNRFSRDAITGVYTTIGLPKGKLIPVVAYTQSYLIDAGLIYIRGITFDTNNTFKSLRPIQVENLSDNTYNSNLGGKFLKPKFFIRHGDSIRLYPAPVEADSIYVFYVARDRYPVANADSAIVPVEYRMAIIYLTAEFCELRRKNFQRASAWHSLYMQEIGMLRKRFEGMEIPLVEEQQ